MLSPMHWDRRANVRGVSGVSGVLGSLPSPGTWQWCDSCARGVENQRHRVSAGGGMRGCSSMDSARRRMTNQWNVAVRWPAAACGGGAACKMSRRSVWNDVLRLSDVLAEFRCARATAIPAPAEFAPFRTSVPFRTSAMPPFAQVSSMRQQQILRDRQRTRAISRFLNDIRQQIFADVPKTWRPFSRTPMLKYHQRNKMPQPHPRKHEQKRTTTSSQSTWHAKLGADLLENRRTCRTNTWRWCRLPSLEMPGE